MMNNKLTKFIFSLKAQIEMFILCLVFLFFIVDSSAQSNFEVKTSYRKSNNLCFTGIFQTHENTHFCSEINYYEDNSKGYLILCKSDSLSCELRFLYSDSKWLVWNGIDFQTFFDSNLLRQDTVLLKFNQRIIVQSEIFSFHDEKVYLFEVIKPNYYEFHINSFGFSYTRGLIFIKSNNNIFIRDSIYGNEIRHYLVDKFFRNSVCLNKSPDFEKEGIFYEVISLNPLEVRVRRDSSYNSLQEIIIPDIVSFDSLDYKVTEIGFGAFFRLKNTISVTLGKNIRQIYAFNFLECDSLQSVKFYCLPPLNESIINEKLYLYVLKENLEFYSKDIKWQNLNFRIFSVK